MTAPTTRICCYPSDPGFISAAVEKIRAAMAGAKPGLSYRLLLSAHGLPKRIITGAIPISGRSSKRAAAIVKALDMPELEPVVCYQSRVGPLEWIGPATDAEIARAGRDGKGVIIAPVAFVSEHSETLVELDIEYRHLAAESGVPDYRRAATVGTHSDFINGWPMAWRALCAAPLGAKTVVTCGPMAAMGAHLPAGPKRCGYN